ncbi:MAG: peptide/nickel transport system permease protein, partial [Actinomycetota bacterium]|nr:peptide/nickel transport system permease protein [Actinomycetota bacterium]
MGRARAPPDEMAVDPTFPNPGTPAALEPGVALGQSAIEGEGGVGPYKLALRRLRHNRTALAFGAMFVVIVLLCLCAPLYANYVAHTTPSANHITDTIKVRGHERDVVSPGGIPTGPTWTGKFLLGADANGRDVAVRLLYGGRNSLEIGFIATFISCFFATVIALAAGYYRGAIDGVLSRTMDLIWAFPVILLGIALGTALAVGGLNFGLFTVNGASLLIPAIIIGVVYTPYMAKPLRGQVLGLREKEFVEAARSQGAGNMRIMFREILPNIASSVIVFIPLMVANA